jgi:hypothetical protein
MSPFVRHPTVRHAHRVLARSVFALVLAVLTATLAGVPGTPAGELAFQTTRSMARGSFALGETPEVELLTQPANATLPLLVTEAGAYYSTQGVAHALFGLPLYLAGWGLGQALPSLEGPQEEVGSEGREGSDALPHLLVSWLNPLLTAATSWLIVLVTRRLGAARHQAWLTGLTYVLTTFVWPQSRGCLPGVAGTFLLFAAFHLTLRARERFDRLELPRARALAAIGVALGLTWITDAALRPAVLVLAATIEVVLVRGHRRLATSRWSPRSGDRPGAAVGLFCVGLPVLAGVLVQVGLDLVRFGTWSDPGGLSRSSGSGAGVLELLVSPGRGLLWCAPLLLLAPLGLWHSWKEGERLYPRALAGVVVAVLVPAVLFADPAGRWSYGPRPLLPLMPFLWVAVGLAFGGAGNRSWRGRAAVALGVLGFLVQLPAALVDESTYADLAEQAGALAWGDEVALDEDELWSRAAWAPNFAAPWAQWRILRHRVAGQGEQFPVREIFYLDDDAILEPRGVRSRSFRHLAWVDLPARLGVSSLAGLLLVLALFVTGAVLAARGLDPGRD